jgi:hypothetical protein
VQVNIREVLAAINGLGECRDDIELHPRLSAIFSQLQVPSFIFSTFRMELNGPTTDYRFLVGCNPEWIQIYQHRHWYSNDPYLQYARCNTAPAPGSNIQITSAGQRDMRTTARQYGCLRIHALHRSLACCMSLAKSKLRTAGKRDCWNGGLSYAQWQ